MTDYEQNKLWAVLAESLEYALHSLRVDKDDRVEKSLEIAQQALFALREARNNDK